jgi:hypothetical protein
LCISVGLVSGCAEARRASDSEEDHRIQNPESRIKNQESRIKNQESRIRIQNPDQGSEYDIWTPGSGLSFDRLAAIPHAGPPIGVAALAITPAD